LMTVTKVTMSTKRCPFSSSSSSSCRMPRRSTRDELMQRILVDFISFTRNYCLSLRHVLADPEDVRLLSSEDSESDLNTNQSRPDSPSSKNSTPTSRSTSPSSYHSSYHLSSQSSSRSDVSPCSSKHHHRRPMNTSEPRDLHQLVTDLGLFFSLGCTAYLKILDILETRRVLFPHAVTKSSQLPLVLLS
jgi:hypothetical protein